MVYIVKSTKDGIVDEVISDPWKSFFFESNQLFKTIKNRDMWDEIRNAYPHMSDDQLLDAKEATYGGTRPVEERVRRPNYGFRIEHDGEKILRDFFVENNMALPNAGPVDSL